MLVLAFQAGSTRNKWDQGGGGREQRGLSPRSYCHKCNTLLNSNHLVNECLRNEALIKLKEIGLEMEEEH